MRKNIDYMDIFKEAAKVVWHKKILAIFGFFIMIGSFGGSFYFGPEEGDVQNKEIATFMAENGDLMARIFVGIILIAILLMVLRAVGIAALAKFAGGGLYEKNLGFKRLFSIGRRYSLRIVMLDLLAGLLLFALIFILLVPIVFLISMNAHLAALATGLFALIIMIPVLFMVYFIRRFAYIFMVVSEMSIRESIEKAYAVFRSNLLHSFIFALVISCLGLLIVIVSLLAAIPLLAAIALPGILALIFIKQVGYILLAVGAFLWLVMFVLIQSFFEAFSQVSWVLLAKTLEGEKTEKTQEESVILLEQPHGAEHV